MVKFINLKKRKCMKKYLVWAMLIILMGAIGCQKKGEGEKVGEKLDKVIDNVKHGDAPLKDKGTMEKAGETIDDALKTDK